MGDVTSFAFKQALAVNVDDGQLQGIIDYSDEPVSLLPTYYYDFTGSQYVEFPTLDPSYDETHHSPENTLVTYINGVEMTYEYYTVMTQYGYPQCVMNIRYRYNGESISDPPGYTPKEFAFNFEEEEDYQDFFSSGGVRWYPSYVSYETNHVTEVGEPAHSVFPLGAIFYKKETDILHPRTELTGKIKFSDLYGWSRRNIGAGITTEEDWQDFLENISSKGTGGDPYAPVDPDAEPFERDPSSPGGGGGDYYPDPDPIGIPDLPLGGAIGTGLVTLYNPSRSQLTSLAQVLWSDDFVTNIKKIMNDPMDGLIFLSLIPYSPTTTGNFNCKIGNFDTGVSMPGIGTQYYQKDCGTVNLKEKWGNALDYSPYTQAEIFLPFVGFRSLKIEDVMKKAITVKYNIDILSGAGVAFVKCGDSVLYQYACNLNSNIPISASNYNTIISKILGIEGGAIGGAIVSGGSPIGAVGGALISATNVAMSKQSSVERGSGIGSFCGMLGDFTPYIVLHRPQQSLPQNFKRYKGYPSNITSSLSALSGYTEVDYVHLDGITATDVEKNEIDRLLKEGVLL